MGFYSSWGCIFSTLVFDWGSIIISEGWGCIQEWGCIQADTVSQSVEYAGFVDSLF